MLDDVWPSFFVRKPKEKFHDQNYRSTTKLIRLLLVRFLNMNSDTFQKQLQFTRKSMVLFMHYDLWRHSERACKPWMKLVFLQIEASLYINVSKAIIYIYKKPKMCFFLLWSTQESAESTQEVGRSIRLLFVFTLHFFRALVTSLRAL